MENIYKEVYFKTYCKTCEYKDLEEKFDKPVYWKEAENGR